VAQFFRAGARPTRSRRNSKFSATTIFRITMPRRNGCAAAADCWRDIASMSDDEVADLVRADEIDVLVDLSGHTKSNRLLVFARKPAPVQATWLGYLNTTGLDAID